MECGIGERGPHTGQNIDFLDVDIEVEIGQGGMDF